MLCALLRVRPDELERLIRRERNYTLVDVTAATRLAGDRPVQAAAQVLLFVGKPDMRVRSDDAGVRIPAAYERRLLRATEAIAPALAAQIVSGLENVAIQRWEPEYRFVDPAQAALV
jgi:hypothetical protein